MREIMFWTKRKVRGLIHGCLEISIEGVFKMTFDTGTGKCTGSMDRTIKGIGLTVSKRVKGN